MIIDDAVRDKVGETAYDTWKDAALADLSNLLCMSQFAQSETYLKGTVSQDGMHIQLPSWYSEIWSVETSNGNLEYEVTYDKDDGLSPATQYANVLTLRTPLPAGTKVSINGRHGFQKLPAPLAGILAAIIQTDQATVDRTDSITSKKIEDVSVSYATNTQTILEHALAPYHALITSWSLCPTRPETGGTLDMPTPHHDIPWWINEQDLGSDDYAIL